MHTNIFREWFSRKKDMIKSTHELLNFDKYMKTLNWIQPDPYMYTFMKSGLSLWAESRSGSEKARFLDAFNCITHPHLRMRNRANNFNNIC